MGDPVKVDFRVLFEKSPGLYLILDQHFFVLAVSDAFLRSTLTNRADLVGQHLFDVFPDDPKDPNATAVRHLRSSLERVVRERVADTMGVQRYDLRTSEGKLEEHYWSATNSPVIEGDEIQYIIHSLEDVTEFIRLKRAQMPAPNRIPAGESSQSTNLETEIITRSQELSAINQQLKDTNEELAMRTAELNDSLQTMQTFTYTMAHDLRGPLRALTGFSKLLLTECTEKLDDTAKDYLERIDASARQMDRLVSDLLAYGQLTHVEVTAIPVALDQVVTQVLHDLGPEIRTRGARIKVESPLPTIVGNITLVKQVLVNLIDNAVKFVPRDKTPEITINATLAGNRARVCIQDNGIGIAPQYHGRVFDLFARLHKANEYTGTGVGLALVKKAMERMMGKVGVESTPSQGSCFWLEFRSTH